MIAAIHLENILFILFILVAFFFQLLTKAATKGSKRSRPSGPTSRPLPPTQEPPRSDEQQIRKFLEALGQPQSSSPPSPVAPRPTYQKPVPHLPPLKSPLPPLTTRPPESEPWSPLAPPAAGKPDWRLSREIGLPKQIPPARETRTFRPRVAETPVFEVHEGPPPQEPIPPAKPAEPAIAAPGERTKSPDFVTLLRSSSGLRQAIILREVFGPPRSFQDLDLVGTV